MFVHFQQILNKIEFLINFILIKFLRLKEIN